MVKLTDRLQCIADMVAYQDKVADIGTDHGYIPMYFLEKNQDNYVIATDVNKGPIEIAKRNFETGGLDEKMITRIGNGIEVLEFEEVDSIVIAGMGGLLIQSILEKDLKKTRSYKQFVVQPRNAQNKLRRWLIENDFEIKREALVIEGKYICEILDVRTAGNSEKKKIYQDDHIFYEIGYELIKNKDPLLKPFIENKIKKEEKIISFAKGQDSLKAEEQIGKSQIKIEKLKEVMKRYGI